MELSAINRIHRKGEFERSEKLYLDYLKAHPDCAMTHALLGTLKIQQGYFGLAKDYSSRALALNPNIEECFGDLVVAYRRLGRTEEAIEVGYKAISLFGERWDRLMGKGKMSPELAQIASNTLNNLGTTLLELARYEEAETVLARALHYSSEHVDANWNLGITRLTQGKWDGWHGYEYGFRAGERKARPYYDEFDNWSGQELKGKTILVWGEQGVGDEILFAQCIPDLKKLAKKVIFDCHPRLEKLFAQSFPGVQCIGKRKDQSPGLFDGQKIDYQTPVGSLPLFFRQTDEQFNSRQYLQARSKEVRRWRERAPGFRIGLAWRGGSQRTGQRKRSMTLEWLLNALEVRPRSLLDDVRLVALQYGEGVFEDIDATRQDIVCEEGAIEDFQQQADLTASCDLVISVVQTTAHLAGALGIRTFCLVPYGPPWKFPPGRSNPWHPSMTQYFQDKPYNWHKPLSDIRNDLEMLLKSRMESAA